MYSYPIHFGFIRHPTPIDPKWKEIPCKPKLILLQQASQKDTSSILTSPSKAHHQHSTSIPHWIHHRCLHSTIRHEMIGIKDPGQYVAAGSKRLLEKRVSRSVSPFPFVTILSNKCNSVHPLKSSYAMMLMISILKQVTTAYTLPASVLQHTMYPCLYPWQPVLCMFE